MEIFRYQFMQNAAVTGLIIGVLCSVLSVFVVLRRMAFIGQGIAHAAFGGIAIGILLNFDILISAAVFCIIIAVLIGIVSRKGNIAEDSSIGLFLTTSMALGVILINLRRGYTPEIFSYLFGNILTVSLNDVYIISVLGALVLGFIIYYHKPLQFFTFDEESAKVANVPVDYLYYMLLTILALVIVMSVQVVGIILVSALLIIPATVSLLAGRRFLQVTVIAVVVGVTSTMSGLFMSYYMRIPTGPAIVAVLFIIFIIVLTVKKIRYHIKSD
jgi:ABC-type Mn2+/Zn2+ transport system permease subunit